MPTTYRECPGVRLCPQQYVGVLALLLSLRAPTPLALQAILAARREALVPAP